MTAFGRFDPYALPPLQVPSPAYIPISLFLPRFVSSFPKDKDFPLTLGDHGFIGFVNVRDER